MREIATKKTCVCSSKLQFRPRSRFTQNHELFVSCLGCQHFISDWLGKLKANKLSTGCQKELKGAAVEKATNPGRRFLFFSRLRRSFSRGSRANFSWLRRSCARLDKTAMLRRLAFFAHQKYRKNISRYDMATILKAKGRLILLRKPFSAGTIEQ